MDNQEINDALAGIMGFVPSTLDDAGHQRYWYSADGNTHIRYEDWNPMVDIRQAMEVKDKLVADGWYFALESYPGRKTVAWFWQRDDKKATKNAGSIFQQGELDSTAICLAALQAKGVEVE